MGPLKLFAKGLGTAISFAFNPLVSGSLIIFYRFAPANLQTPVLNSLSPYITPSTLARIFSVLTVSFWFNIASIANQWLSWRVQNNWVEDKYDWEKEVVLITGASSGFGERVTGLLAEKNIKVIALDIQPLKPEIEAYKSVFFYHCDVTDYATLETIAAQIRADHGDPTVLVNNAGIGIKSPMLEKDILKIQKVIEINLVSNFAMIKQFLPAMVAKNHGHIISIASMATYMSVGSMVDYCASKAGVAALHEGLRQELRHTYHANKVRTSIVHPSWTKTPLLQSWEDQLRLQGQHIMKLDDVTLPLVDLILSGHSQQLLLPKNPIIWALPGLRGWSLWAQEIFRNNGRL